jgi:hypothetical protein
MCVVSFKINSNFGYRIKEKSLPSLELSRDERLFRGTTQVVYLIVNQL